jgi:ribonucleoside-diphosphate reductase alpha chain
MSTFLSEWRMLYESKSGERGIFNRDACFKKIVEGGRREPSYEWGTNPCSEIILRPYQFCNLSEVVVRPSDTLSSLKYKVELATILGTLQSTMTDFRYLRKVWKTNCEEERLLGVSLTGIMDHEMLAGIEDKRVSNDYGTLSRWLEELKEVAVETNKVWTERFGIPQSAAVTCVKPSGTVSKLVDSSSGIHGRYSTYYIQRVRNDIKDPITQFLMDQGVPYEVDVMNKDNMVFSFPMKSPEGSTIAKEQTAQEQLEIWKIYQDHWCEHKPSCTVYYKEGEFLGVGDWVYSNFDSISGVSFLPYDDHTYTQAPYESISEEEYNELLSKMPVVKWGELPEYEDDDFTTGSQELACVGGACEIP